MVRLRYASHYDLNPTVNSFKIIQWNADNIFDVNHLGAGTQPVGRDSMFDHYYKATVLSSKMTVVADHQIQNPSVSTVSGIFGIHLGPASPTAAMSFVRLMAGTFSHTVGSSEGSVAYPTNAWGGLLQEDILRKVGYKPRQVGGRQYLMNQRPVTASKTFSARKWYGIGRQKITKIDGLEQQATSPPNYVGLDVDVKAPVFTLWYTGIHGAVPTAQTFTVYQDLVAVFYEPKYTGDD